MGRAWFEPFVFLPSFGQSVSAPPQKRQPLYLLPLLFLRNGLNQESSKVRQRLTRAWWWRYLQVIFGISMRFLMSMRLLWPRLDEIVCSPPPGCYSVYEENLKSGIIFPLHPSLVEVLRFWNLPLGQIHPIFTRHLVGFIIICWALGVPTSCEIFLRHYDVYHNKDG